MWNCKYCNMSTHVLYIINFTFSRSVLRNNTMRIDIVSINDVYTHRVFTGLVANDST